MGPRLFSRGNLFQVVEGKPTRQASMGPRLFSRGNDPVLAATRRQKPRFNGAAAFQPRKRTATPGTGLPIGRASMGPRLFSRGNKRVAGCNGGGYDMLQWGRGFSAAETCGLPWVVRRMDGFNGAAAFQPRKLRDWRHYHSSQTRFNGAAAFQPRKRGYSVAPSKAVFCASMGPRLFSRGNTRGWPWKQSRPTWLQWGRGFSAAETRYSGVT